MWWWNTGCLLIYNETAFSYTIVDQEQPVYRLAVEPGGSASFEGVIFPWCGDSTDVRNKAFRFYRGAEFVDNLIFHMFQPGPWDEEVAWTGAAGSFDDRQWAGAAKASYVHVFIQANHTPRAVPV